MPKRHEIKYTPPPTIERFMFSPAFVRGIMGPIGSGKSSACCIEIMRQAMNMPKDKSGVRRSRWAVIRNTYGQLRDTTLKTWLEWFPEHLFKAPFHKQDMVHRIKYKDFELEVLFRALDRPEDVDKLLSLELTGAWINEAREIPLEVLEMLEGRVGRFPRRADVPNYRFGIIMDTNPPDTDHWWYRLAEVVAPQLKKIRRDMAEGRWKSYVEAMNAVYEILDMGVYLKDDELKAYEEFDQLTKKYDFFKQPSALSPEAENIQNLDPHYYERLAIGKSQDWIKVYIHGEYGFVVDGKPVYAEYNDSFHFNEKLIGPVDGLKIFRGWDGGRTPACSFSQLLPDGRWLIFDEICAENMGMDQFSDLVLQHCAVEYPNFRFIDVGDPSIFYKTQNDERSAAMILAAKGIELEGGIQDPYIRIECVRRQLRQVVNGEPALQVGPKCQMTRKGFMGGYCYRRMKVSGERYTDKPDKGKYSHIMNALEYVATRLFAFDLLDEDARLGRSEEDEEEIYIEHEPIGRSAVAGY